MFPVCALFLTTDIAGESPPAVASRRAPQLSAALSPPVHLVVRPPATRTRNVRLVERVIRRRAQLLRFCDAIEGRHRLRELQCENGGNAGEGLITQYSGIKDEEGTTCAIEYADRIRR